MPETWRSRSPLSRGTKRQSKLAGCDCYHSLCRRRPPLPRSDVEQSVCRAILVPYSPRAHRTDSLRRPSSPARIVTKLGALGHPCYKTVICGVATGACSPSCWEGPSLLFRVRGEAQWAEARGPNGRERGWGSWGWGSQPPPHQPHQPEGLWGRCKLLRRGPAAKRFSFILEASDSLSWNSLSPRKLSRGIMESPAYVCLSVCLFVCYHDN